MVTWNFIIPFFYGKNKYVDKKGGAPLQRKMEYLTQTLKSIKELPIDSKVTVFVCNRISQEKALTLLPDVQLLNCHPEHLPIEAVRFFQQQNDFLNDDIICFNEDDQIIHMSDSVRQDILASQEVIFSPHRWARTFYFFRKKKRPLFHLNRRRGILDNFDKNPWGKKFYFNHTYVAQTEKAFAYAASWFMKGSLFRKMNFDIHAENIVLESPSYAVFESGIPLLKLAEEPQGNFSNFIVDHLSGYDYNRRLIKF